MKEMKKIIICSHALEIGGVERSLIDLLNCINYDFVEVDLFLYRHSGEWMNSIPDNVRLLPEIRQYASLAVPMVQVLRRGNWGVLLGRIYGKIRANIFNRKYHFKDSAVDIEYSHKYTQWAMPEINPEKVYDMAISFLTPHYFVANKVNAKKKIAWIHTDYSYIGIDIASEKKMWEQYDGIVSISESCSAGFLSKFPELKSKVFIIENVLSETTVKSKAETEHPIGMKKEKGIINLLSIGRFSFQKNFDQIPDICKRIVQLGCNIKWYIIGYGDASKIQENIKKYDLQDRVIILGKKTNPYPYILNCDVYIQPSRYEGKSVTVREAQMLHKPVIITAYPTAKSQVKDGYDGIIVPLENDRCASRIAELLKEKKELDRVASNTGHIDYSNKCELNKLYAFME